MRASRFAIFRAVLVFVLFAALAGSTPAKAGFMLVTDSNSLGANDSASWNGFDVHNPTIISANGIDVRIQVGGTNNTLSQTTLSGSPAIADFGGENYGTSGPSSSAGIILTFGRPVAAVGALMKAEEEGNISAPLPFQVTAFDSNGNSQSFLIGIYASEYVGIISDAGDLSKLTVSAYTYNANTLLEVASLDLHDAPQASSVPAPSGLTLAGLGTLGLFGCRCWRRCRPAPSRRFGRSSWRHSLTRCGSSERIHRWL